MTSGSATVTNTASQKTPLLYALHSGNLYGTERMALATLAGLAKERIPVLFAPPGPALAEANAMGFVTHAFNGPLSFARALFPYFFRYRQLDFIATGVMHSLVAESLRRVLRPKVRHLHLVHGGASELDSYGRKRRLNSLDVTFVAVSDFVHHRLTANGVASEKITTIENFLTQARIAEIPRRPPFTTSGLKEVIVVSRLDPNKRIDLLLEVLERSADLRSLKFTVIGDGWDREQLAERARALGQSASDNIIFTGFVTDVPERLAQADMLLHLCPDEPFGLALLEAMAADLPILAPDSGGAGLLIRSGATGFHFTANNPGSLSTQLLRLVNEPEQTLNRIVVNARQELLTRFSEERGIAEYRHLLLEDA